MGKLNLCVRHQKTGYAFVSACKPTRVSVMSRGGLLRKLAQIRDQVRRSDFRCAASEPEDADGHLGLACERRAVRQPGQLCCSSLLAAAIPGSPQQLLPSQRALLASLPRTAVQVQLCPAVPAWHPVGRGWPPSVSPVP